LNKNISTRASDTEQGCHTKQPLAGLRGVVQTHPTWLGLCDIRLLEHSLLLMDVSCHWPLFSPSIFAVNAGRAHICLLTLRYLIETV